MLHTKGKPSVGNTAFTVMNYFILACFTLICVFPLYYIFINTISNNSMVAKGKILIYPIGMHFENYMQVFALRGLGHAALVSLGRTILGAAFTLIGSSFLGYAFVRREMWHRKIWYRFVIVTMYFNAGIIPWYVTMRMLGLVDNFFAYVLPATVAPFYLILIKTYIEQIPASLEESAQMDGAGYLRRFFAIILPLSTPILATIAIFASVAQWNSFIDTLFLARSDKLFTLQFLLYQYLNEVDSIAATMRNSPSAANFDPSRLLTPSSIRMTITMIVVLPILVVYPFFQRFYVKGMMIGAVKG
jgi:putative aldouronate transport system permease protein